MSRPFEIRNPFPCIEVRGTPRELGRQQGEALRELLRELVELIVDRVNKGRPDKPMLSYEQCLNVAAESIRPADAYAPGLMEELRGVAEGSGVSLEQIMLVNVRNQVAVALAGACTAIALDSRASLSGSSVVAQNWDNDPAMDRFSVVLIRRPEGLPGNMSFTQPGVIGYMGIGENGIGICGNTLPAPARRHGVPWYFALRRIYEQATLKDAIEHVSKVDLAIPINALLASCEGVADIEATADGVWKLEAEESGVLIHTNHCLHPELACVNNDYPELIQSGTRLERTRSLIRETGLPLSVDDLKTILSDHDGFPRSICRHINDDPETGFWTSVVSMILEPSEGRMHLSRGNPCEAPYDVYSLC